MAEARPRRAPPPPQRRVIATAEFRRWHGGLDPDVRARVTAAAALIAEVGPTLGRPHADAIHGSRVRKLKEARVDRSVRVLFAFDSNRNPVMLVGGDKAGKWNRWYPPTVRRAERLLFDHERRIGKEARCLSQREGGRKSSRISR
jgi:hypothetical protein